MDSLEKTHYFERHIRPNLDAMTEFGFKPESFSYLCKSDWLLEEGVLQSRF